MAANTPQASILKCGPSPDESKNKCESLLFTNVMWRQFDMINLHGPRWPVRPCSSLRAGWSDQTLTVAAIWVIQTPGPQSGGPQTGWPHCCMYYHDFPTLKQETHPIPSWHHIRAHTGWRKHSYDSTELRCRRLTLQMTLARIPPFKVTIITSAHSHSLSLSHPCKWIQTHTRNDPKPCSDIWSYISWAKISFAPISGPHFLTILAFPL